MLNRAWVLSREREAGGERLPPFSARGPALPSNFPVDRVLRCVHDRMGAALLQHSQAAPIPKEAAQSPDLARQLNPASQFGPPVSVVVWVSLFARDGKVGESTRRAWAASNLFHLCFQASFLQVLRIPPTFFKVSE
jgi:hypothetical protein